MRHWAFGWTHVPLGAPDVQSASQSGPPSGSMTQLRALVTGASSGIGATYAHALRARGERLILVARRADRLARMAEALGGEEWAVAFPLDLTEAGAAVDLQERVAGGGFAVDLLVNNAGLGHTAPFDEQPPAVVRAMLDVNVRAVVELTHAFLPRHEGAGPRGHRERG